MACCSTVVKGTDFFLHFEKPSCFFKKMTAQYFQAAGIQLPDCICPLLMMGMWIKLGSLPPDLSNPSVRSETRGRPGGQNCGRNRAGRAQARQRALSVRGAGRGGCGPPGAVATPLSSPVTSSLQYPAAVEYSESTIAKALIWARKGEINKICDTLITKCHPRGKYL